MNKERKLLYSDRKADAISFELPDVVAIPFAITGQFTRAQPVEGEKMVKPEKGKYFDPKEETTRIFSIFKLQLTDEQKEELGLTEVSNVYPVEMGTLNNSEGFKDVIVVEDNTFTVLPNAVVTIQDGTLSFAING